MLGGRALYCADEAVTVRCEISPGEEHGDPARAEGQGGELIAEILGCGLGAQQAGDGRLDGLASALAVHDQRVLDLATLDHVPGDLHPG